MDEEIVEEFRELFNFDKAKKNVILNKIITDNIITGDKIDISDDVYKDTGIQEWASKIPTLEGSKLLIKKLIKNPINDRELLIYRQKSFVDYDIDIEILKDYEDDILWIYKISDEISDNSSIEILFPSSFILSYINYFEYLLDTYHMYKIYFIPITSILYPVTTFLAPYFYLNNYMKMNISFSSYINTIYYIISVLLKTSGNFRQDLTKFVTLFLYVGIYLYNMYQTYEIAVFLYNTKEKLHDKMEGLVKFVKHSLNITKNVSKNVLDAFFTIEKNFDHLDINNSMTDIYKIWKDKQLKNKVSALLKTIYGIDVLYSINNLLLKEDWSVPYYNDTETTLWSAKNPVLSEEQVSNPINLDRNIIVTGPNAGGKTTYVKTILSNVILSQTFGITYSLKSKMILYDTINSFMRVSDELGNKSYFEAEAEYCLNMINKANEISKYNKRGLFLMDEPMHSTPPTEGMATAYAVIEYLSKMSGISLIITTHFHKLIKLEELYPDKFINISVDAIPQDNKYYFPYKINKGHSYLCIAIELLDIKDFPKEIIDNAIKMKNKICYNFNK
uniref:DNA mismatch repair protein n=1 Tax=Virus NIOZ-UU159 TaxID=2763270 RepID=A0A7S9SUK9_9VIRU|nr:MAG: DNA mismatch repair protein [Virus NIOZ-UU159]